MMDFNNCLPIGQQYFFKFIKIDLIKNK